jgi:hypothetical protein
VPRLACIIPALGNTESLETTLVSVLERRPDDCEVVVVLNAPYEDPYHLQGEVQFLQAAPKNDLIACLNLGIAATKAPVVHLLASGWQVDDGWTDHALAHFDDPRVAVVTPLVYNAHDHNQLLAAGVGHRRGGRKAICQTIPQADDKSSLHSVGPLLQAAFYRKAALDAIGGLPTGLGDDLADVDLALSLRHACWQTALEPKCRLFAPAIETPQIDGFRAGMHAERLFWRHVPEVGGLVGLLSHPVTALREIADVSPRRKIPAHILGRLAALIQPRHYRQYRLRVAGAQVEAAAAKSLWQERQNRNAAEAKSAQPIRVDAPHKAAIPTETRPAQASRRQKSR